MVNDQLLNSLYDDWRDGGNNRKGNIYGDEQYGPYKIGVEIEVTGSDTILVNC